MGRIHCVGRQLPARIQYLEPEQSTFTIKIEHDLSPKSCGIDGDGVRDLPTTDFQICRVGLRVDY
jgi:hypothetical protein